MGSRCAGARLCNHRGRLGASARGDAWGAPRRPLSVWMHRADAAGDGHDSHSLAAVTDEPEPVRGHRQPAQRRTLGRLRARRPSLGRGPNRPGAARADRAGGLPPPSRCGSAAGECPVNRSRYARPERQPFTSRSRSVTLGAHPGRRCGSGPKASSRRNGSGAASRRCSTSVSLVTGLDSKPKRSCTTPQGARSRAFTRRANRPSCRRQPAASRSGSSWRLLRTPMSSHRDSFPPRSVTG